MHTDREQRASLSRVKCLLSTESWHQMSEQTLWFQTISSRHKSPVIKRYLNVASDAGVVSLRVSLRLRVDLWLLSVFLCSFSAWLKEVRISMNHADVELILWNLFWNGFKLKRLIFSLSYQLWTFHSLQPQASFHHSGFISDCHFRRLRSSQAGKRGALWVFYAK